MTADAPTLAIAGGTLRFDRVMDDHPLRPVQRGAWRIRGLIELTVPLRFHQAQFLGLFSSALAPLHSKLILLPPAHRGEGFAPDSPLVSAVCTRWCASPFPIDAPGTLLELTAASQGGFHLSGFSVERVPLRLSQGQDHMKLSIADGRIQSVGVRSGRRQRPSAGEGFWQRLRAGYA